jgi:hypothetical protein
LPCGIVLGNKPKKEKSFFSSLFKKETELSHPRVMCLSKARVALVILGDAMLVVAIILLLEIDKLVNGTPYDYGLVFNDNWAQPYWLMFRVTLALIVVAIILISVVELPYPSFEEKTVNDTRENKVTKMC